MKNPLVSIITPTYNRADFLVETIESVLSQNYSNFEYIVLDDGSKDKTIDILKRYENRIKWFSHSNMGETLTVNKGFSISNGEIIIVVNSDDPLLPNAISTGVSFLLQNPNKIVAYPDWVKIGPKSEIIEYVKVPDYDYLYMLKQHHCIVGPGAFIRRKAFDYVGFRDPSFKYVADFDFWLRLGLYSDFIRIPNTLASFRVHNKSASVNYRGHEMAKEHIILVNKIFSHPKLPKCAQKKRAEAFYWAYQVASEMCDNKSFHAKKLKLIGLYYYPLITPKFLYHKIKKYFSNL